MSRVSYVNGQYMWHGDAAVHIDDRGYQFGDGVYEVITIIDGQLVDQVGHLNRLEYSLGEVMIPMPMSRAALTLVIKHLVRLNRVRSGFVYFQVTRGVMPRNHVCERGLTPQLIMTVQAMPKLSQRDTEVVKVITVADQRWKRRDIKTLQLLPNCLAKTKAHDAGANEAWMIDADGYITEGSGSNAWIVTHAGEIITRPLGHDILAGVTRKAVLALASQRNLKVVERPFTLAEAFDAAEAFMTSASRIVAPVGEIDGHLIGDGEIGTLAGALRQSYYNALPS